MKRRKGKFSLDAKKSLVLVSQVVVVLLAIFLLISLIDRFVIHSSVNSTRSEENSPTRVERTIQVSVRNECGVNDLAMSYTFFLRKRGFDVVETINGSSRDREYTTVVDAAGNYQNAMRVAEALGVKRENVVTRLDQRSYVDVEVLIGKDYRNLKPNESIE